MLEVEVQEVGDTEIKENGKDDKKGLQILFFIDVIICNLLIKNCSLNYF